MQDIRFSGWRVDARHPGDDKWIAVSGLFETGKERAETYAEIYRKTYPGAETRVIEVTRKSSN